jgi:hypothetical protein
MCIVIIGWNAFLLDDEALFTDSCAMGFLNLDLAEHTRKLQSFN